MSDVEGDSLSELESDLETRRKKESKSAIQKEEGRKRARKRRRAQPGQTSYGTHVPERGRSEKEETSVRLYMTSRG